MKKLLFFLSCGWIFLTLSGCSSTTEAETNTETDSDNALVIYSPNPEDLIEEGKIKKSRLETLEKIAKALKLDEQEREELFSVLVPKDISVKILKNPLYKELDSRGRMQFKEIVEQSSLMFNDENISEEDKQKVLLAIQDAFYDAKQKNKKKK